MIINKIKTEYDGETLKTLLDVSACDCEIEALYDTVGNDINICATCDEGCDGKYDELPEPLFGGAYYCNCDELVYIEKVIYSKPAVIVIWSDGTKTRSTCDKEDIWNPELGLTLCVLKKTQGQSFVTRLFRDWAIEISGAEITSDEKPAAKTITLKDVRRNLKDFSDANDFAEKVSNN